MTQLGCHQRVKYEHTGSALDVQSIGLELNFHTTLPEERFPIKSSKTLSAISVRLRKAVVKYLLLI